MEGMSDWSTYVSYGGGGAAVPKKADPLAEASDEELVFEMLKRGYAVAKMDAQDLAEGLK